MGPDRREQAFGVDDVESGARRVRARRSFAAAFPESESLEKTAIVGFVLPSFLLVYSYGRRPVSACFDGLGLV